MKYRSALMTVIMSCGAVLTAADVPTERYVSAEGGYVAFFPEGADIKTKTVDIPGGLKAVITTATLKAAQQTYIVTYTPHQKGVLKAPAKATLELGEKATIAQPKTTRLGAKDFLYGKAKYPAREILTERDGHQTRTRFVAADPVLYTIVVGGPKEFASGEAASAFLDSIELTPGKVKAKK
ncbi:hypothetical protein [Urbifossiella limnaea]|uniref:DUF1795 domain-containing protein n=1 Tax=Urbifossiella limnaea TaxID=2528023 RepID=A0A517XKU9_9BACT|nr:hypothetical protein [Urbifossiella limnaea]QDU18133.1 hypothetical protein ETAA1_00160 [Urbifossiella limnaea]